MLGNFSDLVEQYNAARPAYPKAVFSLIFGVIKKDSPYILDIGCGTGISTRQLAKNGARVIGYDVDLMMLNAALQHKQANVSYALGSVEKLPFAKASFDAVTAFTSFHWFMNKKAIKEIKRVLKPKAVIAIVHPWHTAPHAKDLRKIIQGKLQKKLPSKYADLMKAEVFLNKKGFKGVTKKVIKDKAKYTLEQYLILLQSHSIWNYVPPGKRKEFLKLLRTNFQTKLRKGFIWDTKDIDLIIGRL